MYAIQCMDLERMIEKKKERKAGRTADVDRFRWGDLLDRFCSFF